MSAPANGQQQLPPITSLIKPEQVSRITAVPEEMRSKYAIGVEGLWKTLDSRPQDSKEYREAHVKLYQVTMQIRGMMAKRQQMANQATRQQQQNGAARPTNGQPPNAQASVPQQAAQLAQEQPPSQPIQVPQQQQQSSQQSQQMPMPRQQQPLPNNSNPSSQLGQLYSQANVASKDYSPRVLQKVKEFQFLAPPGVIARGPQFAEKYIAEARATYAQKLSRYERDSEKLTNMERAVKERTDAGQPLTQDEEQQYAEQRKIATQGKEESADYLRKFTAHQSQLRGAAQGQSVGGQAGQMTRIESDQGISAGASTGPALNNEVEQAQKMGFVPDPARRPQDNTATQGAVPGSTTIDSMQQLPAQVSQPPPARLPGPPAGQVQQHGQHSIAPPQQIKTEERPSIQPYNPLPPNAPSHPSGPQGQAFPLSHEAAMQQARSYSNSNINTQYHQNQPHSATHSHPPNQHSRESQIPQNSSHTKMPIPKDLNVPPVQPVSMGQNRPTMTNGPHVTGPIGQPAIQKHPGYVLEGEGERVLSRKKLEELVRQVTGGTGAEGDDSESLTAEVEETLLQVADDFVDQVIVSACRLAKLRNSSTLEIRDLQLILERNYNIRVPGFASDEIRAVRKVAPTVGWTQKLSAVQAAKVTGSGSGIGSKVD